MIHLIPIVIILIVANSKLLNKFYSRKLVHLGCGVILAKINLPNQNLSYVICFIAISSIVICCIKPFYFAKLRDVGVISYNLTILLFVLFQIPIRILLPMFVVDPVASLVGTNFKSPVWIHTKTVLGSLSCLLFSYLTLYYVTNMYHRLLLSVILTLSEGIFRSCDNLAIISILVFYYFLSFKFNYKIRLEFNLF